ncbi:glycosyltransferase [Patescibacteria group bacterium]|nr:glycosyltransferase [Candidatus Falkowbacteria bacterium]MBU3906161.1 glycosyltransferase [Patescibacteria group bacterium]MCG2697509.1 glycosyltransferase [Candidatus Parcubacteria bacterium]MBU4014981.1 glycosyltransferase [Patescibacteria group bacterium]MBU4026654.1 glycosyltransferase [Patescibacteria group bacterium]
MKNALAPICLFAYNRPWHTKQMIEALVKNELANESELLIFSDGPKDDESKQRVAEVRSYLKNITGFKSITIIERTKNYSLAKSIISGVTEVINKYGKVIVMEDDLVSSPYFLKYMNEALDLYESEEKVISIHGYIYPVKAKLPETYFIKGADCWGWGTWKRGWALFEADGQKLLNKLREKKLTKEFDFNNSFDYTGMLENYIKGKNNSWAIRWYASAFLQNKLTLCPGKSLINNIGLDGTGTHCTENNNDFNADIYQKEIKLNKISIEENKLAKKIISKYFESINPGYKERIINKIKKIWKI